MTAAEGAQTYEITAGRAEAGERIDRLLAARLPAITRNRLKNLILAGWLSSGGETIDEPAYRVKPGQTFAIIVPEAAAVQPQAQAIPLDIVHEDPHIIVLNKPAGMVVHPAPGNPDRTLVNALIAHCGEDLTGIGGTRRPGIVHRLDKGTSGLMVAAKTEPAHQGLIALFAERDIERAYQAIAWGVPEPRAGEIAGNIGRSPRNRKKMAVLRRGGKPGRTRYRVLRELAGGVASLVECRLLSGRTHQIRVHLTEKGHPLLGDPLYGRAGAGRLQRLPAAARAALGSLGRQALHAKTLGFRHPVTGEELRFDSQLPGDIRDLINCLEVV
ncbi:MAG: RluA family pseudouridine synthase [Kiloniellaceae bacterium]